AKHAAYAETKHDRAANDPKDRYEQGPTRREDCGCAHRRPQQHHCDFEKRLRAKVDSRLPPLARSPGRANRRTDQDREDQCFNPGTAGRKHLKMLEGITCSGDGPAKRQSGKHLPAETAGEFASYNPYWQVSASLGFKQFAPFLQSKEAPAPWAGTEAPRSR